MNWIDVDLNKQHTEDMIKAAQQDRLVRNLVQVQSPARRPNIWLARLGGGFVMLGSALQARSGMKSGVLYQIQRTSGSMHTP